MRPIIPEAGKINRSDEVASDTLHMYIESVSTRYCSASHGMQIKLAIQNPLRKEAIANAATKIGTSEATTADCSKKICNA